MHEALETLKEYEAFQIFIEKWHELEKNKTIPTWYRFSPKNPQERPWDPRKPFDGHGMMKKWDSAMFEFLKDQNWNEAGVKENRTSSVNLFCSVLFCRTQNRTEHQRKMSYRTQNRTELGRKMFSKKLYIRVRYFHGVFRTLLSI